MDIGVNSLVATSIYQPSRSGWVVFALLKTPLLNRCLSVVPPFPVQVLLRAHDLVMRLTVVFHHIHDPLL